MSTEEPKGRTQAAQPPATAYTGINDRTQLNPIFARPGESTDLPVDRIPPDESLPGARTRLVGRSVMTSREALEAMIASGMEYGVREGYEKLDELLGRAAS